MAFLPSTIAKIADIKGVRNVAFVRLLKHSNLSVLLTGGSEPHIVFLDGDRKGKGFPLENVDPEDALIIEGIEFECDWDTMYQPALVDQPVGAFKIARDFYGLAVEGVDGHGFPVIKDIDLGHTDVLRRDPLAGNTGFKTWRISKTVGDRKIDLFRFETTRTAHY